MVKVNSRTIQRLLQGHGQFIREADEARRYYSNVNRIKQDNSVLQRQAETEQALGNPLHLADNRISHSWHNLLVTQKVSYALSYPPVFDVGSKTANERIAEILGDQYTATAMQLGIDASNTSVGWLHYWRGTDGRFRYHTVDPEQIVPVFSGTLESDLVGVLRCYTMLDPQSGQTVQVCEYWDDTTCRFYRQNGVSGNYTYGARPGKQRSAPEREYAACRKGRVQRGYVLFLCNGGGTAGGAGRLGRLPHRLQGAAERLSKDEVVVCSAIRSWSVRCSSRPMTA